MYGLLELSDRKEVREIVSRAIEMPDVQGVVAEYAPLWLMCRELDSQEWDFFWRMYRYSRCPIDQLVFFRSGTIGRRLDSQITSCGIDGGVLGMAILISIAFA